MDGMHSEVISSAAGTFSWGFRENICDWCDLKIILSIWYNFSSIFGCCGLEWSIIVILHPFDIFYENTWSDTFSITILINNTWCQRMRGIVWSPSLSTGLPAWNAASFLRAWYSTSDATLPSIWFKPYRNHQATSMLLSLLLLTAHEIYFMQLMNHPPSWFSNLLWLWLYWSFYYNPFEVCWIKNHMWACSSSRIICYHFPSCNLIYIFFFV